MPLQPQASVLEIVSEMNGTPTTGTGPYTIFDNGGVTGALISGAIYEANAMLQAWTGLGGVSGDAVTNEQIRRFETNYASAKVAANIIGIISIDGFNYSVGGLDVQRMGAKFQTYELFIRKKLDLAEYWIKALRDRSQDVIPTYAQGTNEYGNPIGYWSTANPRY